MGGSAAWRFGLDGLKEVVFMMVYGWFYRFFLRWFLIVFGGS